MIQKTLLTLLISSFLYAGGTATTTTSFVHDTHPTTDKYGNEVYDDTVIIKTDKYKVDNFWKKFSFGGKGQDNMDFQTISKTGTVRVTVETTSACTLDNTLNAEGCSGQKPFLMNNEVLNNPMDGKTDEYEVAFSEASNYSNTDKNTFYPLDIRRDKQYYEDPKKSNPNAPSRGFFGFFTSSFDFIFSKTVGFGSDFFGNPDIADVLDTPRSNAAEDRRQRYLANIIAGVDKKNRMTKEVDGSIATQIKANAPVIINKPTSLLHYAEAQKTTTSSQCKFMFLNLSSNGLMCRVMGGFGMDAWMPFFNKTKTTEIQSNYIMGDTENALLAMTGKIQNVPYMKDVGGNSDNKLSFLQNMLKPMKTMFGFMSAMIFGSSKSTIVSKPVERVYKFNEDEAMTMTFAMTNDGTKVNDFAHFKLLKIRSVYGDKLNSCTVKKTAGVVGSVMGGIGSIIGGSNDSSWKETFYEGDAKKHHGKTGDEWVDWCQQATGKKGIFDYLTDWKSGAMFNPVNWMKGIFSAFMSFFFGSYSIEDITNDIGRGLILNLKKIEADPLSQRNTSTYKLMGTK